MNIEEARKIAAIVGTADDGCSSCVGDLVDQLGRDFPQFRWETTNEMRGDGIVVNVSPTEGT